MNLRIIAALVKKDIVLVFRNKLFLLIIVLTAILYPIIYFVTPTTVDESLKIGLYSEEAAPPIFQQLIDGGQAGLGVEQFDTDQALRDAVDKGQYIAGIALPADILTGVNQQIRIYYRADASTEIAESLRFMVSELAYLQYGQLPVTFQEVLGTDLIGAQIPMRDQLRTLLPAVLIITMLFGLATLISEEFEGRTVRAVLVSPANIVDFFVAKGIFGVGMAFSQALLFMIIVSGLGTQTAIVILTILLGALVVTGIGFLTGAFSKDNMSAVSLSFVAMMIMLLPAMIAIVPGTVSIWVKIIPSYYIVDTLHRATNFGMGWSVLWPNLLIMLGFSVAFLSPGILALRRKIQ
ncbi:ABC transporter permease [Chloroflexota bacterium]